MNFGYVTVNGVNSNEYSKFRKMLDSPFFGRVDFRYDGDDEPEIFYIGIGNFAERPGELPLIYDWRSPVSGLFYDFDRGPASYLAPGGDKTAAIKRLSCFSFFFCSASEKFFSSSSS